LRIIAGLRTEIILNLSLLMGGALLFAGLLLLRLTERELLDQRVGSLTDAMTVVARSLEPEKEPRSEQAASLLGAFPARMLLQEWVVVDRNMVPVATSGGDDDLPISNLKLSQARFAGHPVVRVRYPLIWRTFGISSDDSVLVTVPIVRHSVFTGAVQARFSLRDVRQRVFNAQRFMLLYVLLYAGVLVPFAVYLLNRTIIRPVRRLQEGTRQVAAGNLERALPVEGPREIADLARSFNVMMGTLEASREETLDYIVSLQQANGDLQRAQQELIRSEKMASVGHLAAGMAHEIGNPVSAMLGYLELLKAELPAGRQSEIAERSLAEVARIDQLVKDLLDYAAPAEDESPTAAPSEVLAEAAALLEHQGALTTVRLAEDFPPSLPPVAISRHKLLQVMINLLLNARDASAEGGTIRLGGSDEGGGVRLWVADEGEGIGEETLPHIFDPFYTGKPPGKGRGLGLFVCHRIVEEAGGRIEVHSRKDRGTTFTVQLNKVRDEVP